MDAAGGRRGVRKNLEKQKLVTARTRHEPGPAHLLKKPRQKSEMTAHTMGATHADPGGRDRRRRGRFAGGGEFRFHIDFQPATFDAASGARFRSA
jgi:hypothetical protein